MAASPNWERQVSRTPCSVAARRLQFGQIFETLKGGNTAKLRKVQISTSERAHFTGGIHAGLEVVDAFLQVEVEKQSRLPTYLARPVQQNEVPVKTMSPLVLPDGL
jgi:hypothetical protein